MRWIRAKPSRGNKKVTGNRYISPVRLSKKHSRLSVNLKQLRHIAIGGGGAAGVGPIGGVMCMHDYGLLDKVEYFSGTSSGSILAAPLAVGYRGKELERIVLEQDFSTFMTPTTHEAKRIRVNLANKGIYSGNEVRRWIEQMLARRLGEPRLTFREMQEYRLQAEAGNLDFFKEKCRNALGALKRRQKIFGDEFSYEFITGAEGPTLNDTARKLMEYAKQIRELNVVASEVDGNPGNEKKTQFHEKIFNAENTPEVSIAQAVRASAAFPFFFRQATIGGKKYTDGGLTNLIPLNAVAEKVPRDQSLALHPWFARENPRHPVKSNPKSGPGLLPRLLHYFHVLRFSPGDIPMPPATGIKQNVMREINRFMAAYRLSFLRNQQPDGKTSASDYARMAAEHIFGPEVVQQAAEQTLRVESSFWDQERDRVIPIDRGNVGATDFGLGRAGKQWLLKKGYQDTEKEIQACGIRKPKEAAVARTAPAERLSHRPNKIPRVVRTHTRASPRNDLNDRHR